MARSIEIVRAVGVALDEDAGRAGLLRHAIPRGGALDPEGLALANAAVGNELGAAGIERYGPLEIVANDDVVLSDEQGTLTVLARGASARFYWDGSRRVRYLAIDGAIDVPRFFGGSGTLLSIGRGGLDGRPLRRGDVLALGPPRERGTRRALADHDGPIRVTPGPDLERLVPDAVAQLCARAWTLDARSDRMGTRLVGASIASRCAARAITTPMIEGAIECPPDSGPIVLGPEHPTTGGYPVVAVVIEVDLPRFHRIALGREARFVVA